MCGRLIAGEESWSEHFDRHRAFLDEMNITEMDPDAPAAALGFNVKPTQSVNIAINGKTGLRATTARWWFVPHYFNGTPKDWSYTTFNARIEKANETRTFKQAWQTGRCVLPVRGYYEWQKLGKEKQPWVIAPQGNAPMFFLAGLWEKMQDGTATCAILTRAPDPALASIHNRMPVMLRESEITPWMANASSDDVVKSTLGDGWAGRFDAHKVRRFGMKDDGDSLIEPFDPDLEAPRLI